MTKNLEDLKVAIAHEYLIKNGGAERVLQAIHDIFPKSTVYTLVYNEQTTGGIYKKWDIQTSYLQSKPLINYGINYYRAAMPQAVESFDFSKYDLVISDSSSVIKGIITQPETLHVCYMHTPTRYLWFDIDFHINRGKFFKPLKWLIPTMLHKQRQWDYIAAQRPDYIISNSVTTQSRILKFYHRESELIHPPVNMSRNQISERDPQDYYLIVSRLEPHKNIDMAIKAAINSKQKLKIIGVGTDLDYLKKISNENIEFLGKLTDEQVAVHFSRAKAFLAPQTEDFGITMVEALAAGCPVIANAKGGALEIVEHNVTGRLLPEINSEQLSSELLSFDISKYKPENCRDAAEKFSSNQFTDKLRTCLKDKLIEYHRDTK